MDKSILVGFFFPKTLSLSRKKKKILMSGQLMIIWNLITSVKKKKSKYKTKFCRLYVIALLFISCIFFPLSTLIFISGLFCRMVWCGKARAIFSSPGTLYMAKLYNEYISVNSCVSDITHSFKVSFLINYIYHLCNNLLKSEIKILHVYAYSNHGF